MYILSVLFLFAATQADCSNHTTDGATACVEDNECRWIAGKCKQFSAADCTLGNCRLGCKYTPPVAGECTNSYDAVCEGRSTDACEGDTRCQKAKKCVDKTPLYQCSPCQQYGCNFYHIPACEVYGWTGGCAKEDIYRCEYSDLGCKLSENRCVDLTPDEKCSKFNASFSTMSECDFEPTQCKTEGDACVATAACENNPDCICQYLSTAHLSNCEADSGRKCVLNSQGVCVSLVCSLNNDKTACNNPRSDNCSYNERKPDCGNYVCDWEFNTKYEPCAYYGCDVSEESVCIVNNTYCTAKPDGTCDGTNATCKTTSPAIPEACEVDDTNETNCNIATAWECNHVQGCNWDRKDGGTCVEKTCASDPSYDRCCQTLEPFCEYCADLSKPSDCPSNPCVDNPSYANCCPSRDPNCGYCSRPSKPSDCPNTDSECTSNPTYANCCPGAGCDGFCTGHPEDSGCKSGASNIFAPFVFLALFFILF